MDSKFEKSLKILSLDRLATLDDIKSEYRKLVKIHHPDLFKNPENKEKAANNFKVITNAYEYLKENYVPPEKRKFSSGSTDSQQKSSDVKTKKSASNSRTGTKSGRSNNNSYDFYKYKKDENDKLISLLKMCVDKNILVRIKYESSSYRYRSSISNRVILPQGLYLGKDLKKSFPNKTYNYSDEKMYLIAYCMLRKAKRTFRIDRIISIEVLQAQEAAAYQEFTSAREEYQEAKVEENQEQNSSTQYYNQNSFKDESNLGCIIWMIMFALICFFSFF